MSPVSPIFHINIKLFLWQTLHIPVVHGELKAPPTLTFPLPIFSLTLTKLTSSQSPFFTFRDNTDFWSLTNFTERPTRNSPTSEDNWATDRCVSTLLRQLLHLQEDEHQTNITRVKTILKVNLPSK